MAEQAQKDMEAILAERENSASSSTGRATQPKRRATLQQNNGITASSAGAPEHGDVRQWNSFMFTASLATSQQVNGLRYISHSS